MVSVTSSNQAEDDVVADDIACHRCGYNLRTLRSGSTCPECGVPVAATFALLAARPRVTALTALHDAMALCCSAWVGMILFSGEFGWRDGPPPLSFFVLHCILPVAVGTGLSIGCLRSRLWWRRLIGVVGLGTCGLFLLIILYGSLEHFSRQTRQPADIRSMNSYATGCFRECKVDVIDGSFD